MINTSDHAFIVPDIPIVTVVQTAKMYTASSNRPRQVLCRPDSVYFYCVVFWFKEVSASAIKST